MSRIETVLRPHNELLNALVRGPEGAGRLERLQASFSDTLSILNDPSGWIPLEEAAQAGLKLPANSFAVVKTVHTNQITKVDPLRDSKFDTEQDWEQKSFKALASSARFDLEKLLTLDPEIQKGLGVRSETTHFGKGFEDRLTTTRVNTSFAIADSI